MPTIKVKGMSCQHCVASVTRALREIEGVSDVQVNLETGEAAYSATAAVKADDVSKAVTAAGYEVA